MERERENRSLIIDVRERIGSMAVQKKLSYFSMDAAEHFASILILSLRG